MGYADQGYVGAIIQGGTGLTFDTVADMQTAATGGSISDGDTAFVVAESKNYFVDAGTVYPIDDALVEVATVGDLPGTATEGDLAIDRANLEILRYTSGAWVKRSDRLQDFSTLTALYDARDAGDLEVGSVYRVAWSGDPHVADGQIVTQWDGSTLTPNPLAAGIEIPSFLIESADWQLVNGQATGSLSFDGDGRPIMTVDVTTTGYAGITTSTRFEDSYQGIMTRVEMSNVNGLGSGAFNRLAPVAFVGSDINLGTPFVPRFAMAGSFQGSDYFSNCRYGAGGYAETIAALGRSWTASEKIKSVFTNNNDSADTSCGFAFGLEAGDLADQTDSNNQSPELLESPLSLRPAMMALCPNTGTGGTATAKLLGLRLSKLTETTDPRVY